MKILDYLKNELKYTNIESFCHNSHNKHYTALNEQKKEIFIKIFNNKKLFENEVETNLNYQPSKIIKYFEYKEQYVIIFLYLHYLDFHFSNLKKIKSSAKLIAEFYQKCQLQKTPINLYNKLEEKYILIEKNEKIEKIYNYFILKKEIIELEYSNMQKVIIHGDFGERNIKYLNNSLELIDFERIKYSIPYVDFIKLFNRELNTLKKQNIFLKEYKKFNSLEIPTDDLKNLLNFIEVLGIIKYLKNNESKSLEIMKNKIIQNLIKDYFLK